MNIAKIHRRFLTSSGVSTDTRNIKPNSLFFALKGENFNGNEFAEEALNKGAEVAIVDEEAYAKDQDNYIFVEDCLDALQQLATFHRHFLGIPVLAITGSNGKTTTKELINAVLTKKYKTISTTGNLNNHIGVPLTLLRMDETTEVGVVEMGANHQGEIEFLTEIALPDYGYITNFGKAHLEGFGGIEGVIKGKSELYTHLKNHKKLLFLNLDDEIQQRQDSYSHVFTFGSSEKAAVSIDYTISQNGPEYASFTYNNDVFNTQLTGQYNAYNAAAALTIGLYFKVPFKAIKEAIKEYSPSNNRSQIQKTKNNTLLLDAYNANPTSMGSSIINFSNLNTPLSKTLIIGDMLELGQYSKEEHQSIVELCNSKGLKNVYLVGKHFKETSTPEEYQKFDNTTELKTFLTANPINNSYILIKGSRGIALEKIIENL
ncbi:UDP-N-acetylmuramoyl-tripeptide--D-alanyl-D-alanine ligase [Zunongwangia profunda]|uniref:UDP-N-acetylmuramoyl-tripeptide--D-alanyl-D-alanine ligase n=2 Tax=Zunongwangia profunda TaxID=398743 RepID=D5BM94_ZUNPS|nr:UDP-N-acetylmuramoyl-tripeptide--D-alanyl-D-alanine ligase [Zunongwangia profunda]ADF54234.1 UDP-N-acetylmuramoyl-tripeptide--D-alanyl-D-alanine ligase [Zunongwangia profunda SM-A87]MAG87537.1 UDP-N-acetylmuramoyl-tripeptide--D-alanyl-D-alanine ligase [Flavobacteriaceae bacterium]HAJ80848.1 UDP-N-acetylmuramoyl-tripeptide--D-alanyl-D-alanine ligase [Zunongwangia profunda]|tara:strand:- start:233 stop:1525 length:1293 start_codon:yes stop_codon:yes gene_type:complete